MTPTSLLRLPLLLLLLGVLPLDAEEALLLPPGNLRLSGLTTFSFASSTFAEDGTLESFDFGSGITVRALSLFGLGASAEYGFDDRFLLGVSWTPGANLSIIDDDPDSGMYFDPFFDITLFLKVLAVGEKGLLHSDFLRIALAPLAIVPLPGPDFETEFENAANDKPYMPGKSDRHSLGLGLRLWCDLVFARTFSVNLFAEGAYYFPVLFRDLSLGFYALDDSVWRLYGIESEAMVSHGIVLTAEGEPRVAIPLGGLSVVLGLPVSFQLAPDLSLTSISRDDIRSAYEGYLTNTGSMSLSIQPTVRLDFSPGGLPLDIALAYRFVAYGQNTAFAHTFALQVRTTLTP